MEATPPNYAAAFEWLDKAVAQGRYRHTICATSSAGPRATALCLVRQAEVSLYIYVSSHGVQVESRVPH